MAWELLTSSVAKMWGKKGVISWNDETYRLLGDPAAVEILYDAEEGRIGFHGVFYAGALVVRKTDDLRYSVDAQEYVDEAGLDLPNNWTATPQVESFDAGSVPGIPHTNSVIWIATPT